MSKKLVTDSAWTKPRLRKFLRRALKSARRSHLVGEVRAAWKVDIRRTCAFLRADRSGYLYKGRRSKAGEQGLDICAAARAFAVTDEFMCFCARGREINAGRASRSHVGLGFSVSDCAVLQRPCHQIARYCFATVGSFSSSGVISAMI